MQAIEFNTIIKNGSVIIPPEYSSEWEGKTIRAIVLDEAVPAPHLAETKPPRATNDRIEEPQVTNSIFSRLKQIKISAPPDFAENLDDYLSGEKNV